MKISFIIAAKRGTSMAQSVSLLVLMVFESLVQK